ncbi:MAG: hypothetical protein RLP44_32370 [Aggregatilineales bacterium]
MQSLQLRRFILAITMICLLALAGTAVQAQEGGQFCLRAFEDRDNNGVRDAGDPAITRGVSAVLMNAENVIIASALMDDSPTAARGVICFLGLESQQYTMMVTSADFTATAGDNMIVNVVAGEQPPVLEFGGQRVATSAVQTSPTDTTSDEDALVERALVAGGGAVGVMLFMAFIGLFIYLLFFRNRRPQPAYPMQYPPDSRFRPPTDTGQYPRTTDTGQYRQADPRSTDTGQYRPPTDTGQHPRQ